MTGSSWKTNGWNTRLLASSNASALARVVKYRLNQLGVDDLDENEETPLVDAMLSIKDAGHEGWYLEVLWYPIGVATVCLVIGMIYIKNKNQNIQE